MSTHTGSIVGLLVRENCSDKVGVIDLPRTSIDSLQQLIHFLIAHLLPQVCQDISQLTHADVSREILVENLETATVFFWLAWVTESARSVENLGECLEVEITADILLQFSDLVQCRILTACSEQISQLVQLHTLGTTLVEELECFSVVCGGHFEG